MPGIANRPETRTAEPTLASIMTREVVTVEASATLREVLEGFVEDRISGAPVVQGGEVVGVVSTTDLIDFVSSEADLPVETASDLEPDDLDGEDGSSYFVDLWDDIEPDVATRVASETADCDRFDSHTVAEIMSPGVHSLPSTATVRLAAARLLELQVHRMLVIDDDLLVGLVTTTDIVRGVAEGFGRPPNPDPSLGVPGG